MTDVEALEILENSCNIEGPASIVAKELYARSIATNALKEKVEREKERFVKYFKHPREYTATGCCLEVLTDESINGYIDKNDVQIVSISATNKGVYVLFEKKVEK